MLGNTLLAAFLCILARPIAQSKPVDDLPGQDQAFKDTLAAPLWSEGGPVVTDILQGSDGDCWLLATLAALVKCNPAAITSIVEHIGIGDGKAGAQTDKVKVRPIPAKGGPKTFEVEHQSSIGGRANGLTNWWSSAIRRAAMNMGGYPGLKDNSIEGGAAWYALKFLVDKEVDYVSEPSKEQAWEWIQHSDNSPMVLETLGTTRTLMPDHDYAIMSFGGESLEDASITTNAVHRSFLASISLSVVLFLLQALPIRGIPTVQPHPLPRNTPEDTSWPLFSEDRKPQYDDILEGSTGYRQVEPSSSFGTVLSLLTYLNASSIEYLFDDVPPSTNAELTNVKLYILEDDESVQGAMKTYGVNYTLALAEGVGLLSWEKKVGWPAVLRSAILQHHIPGLSSDNLNNSDTLSKDYMRALTGMEFQVSIFSQLENEIWTTWRYFSPRLYPYIFQTTSTAQKLKPDMAYGVFSVDEDAQTIDLYHPSPEIGKGTYAWNEIKGDLNLLSWREDLKVLNEENRLSGGNGSVISS